MHTVRSGDATISYTKTGSGPALVLVHGGWNDHEDVWRDVLPAFERRFTCIAVARRGRAESSTTTGHTIDDEAEDVRTVIDAAQADVYLLGHSYGARCALDAAMRTPRVKCLVLYEPADGDALSSMKAAMEAGARGDWEEMLEVFMGAPMTAMLRPTPFWAMMLRHAAATLEDSRALVRSPFEPERYRELTVPVLLLKGTETWPEVLKTTDTLASVLPDCRVVAMQGQGHSAMWTAPALFVKEVEAFLPSA